jgi:hypothetical protein
MNPRRGILSPDFNCKIPDSRHTDIAENGFCHYLLLIMDNRDTPLIRGALWGRMNPSAKRRYKQHAVQWKVGLQTTATKRPINALIKTALILVITM